MKRLIADDINYPYGIFDGQSFTAPNIVKDFENTFVNNNITKIQYTPTIDRTFNIFETQYENTENMLLSSKEWEEIINMSNEKWVKAFVQAIKGEKVQSTQPKEYKLNHKTKTAEINVGDLPKIIWHEEEYRVLFNKDGEAEILNNFGNHVLSLEDTYTIKQVNEQLADREIVPEDYRQDEAEMIFENLTPHINKPDTIIKKANEEDNGTYKTDIERQNIPHYGIDPIEEFTDIQLSEEEVDSFLNDICPFCNAEGTLERLNDIDGVWTVECSECKALYKMNEELGDIHYIETENTLFKTANLDNQIELLNKTLFIEEMAKHDYDDSMVDMLITNLEFEGQVYEINVILKDSSIVDIITYIDNKSVDTPNAIYNVVMQDINECNIE